MFNDINNSFLTQSGASWFGTNGNSNVGINQDLDGWFDTGICSGSNQNQWAGGIGPVQSGCSGQGQCSSQQGWPDWAGQGSCGTQQGWPGYPGQGPGPVQPGWPGCHPDKICVTPQELSHIIEEILESKGNKKCYKGANNMCCSNSGCLGYAPQNNCCCGYNGYAPQRNCGCGYNGYNYGNYGYGYNYGNYGYGNDDGLWWIILIFFFFGGFCFF